MSRAIVSIDPGIKNFAYSVIVTTNHTTCARHDASSIQIPDPGFLVWKIEKFDLTTTTAASNANSKDAMYAECGKRIGDVCAELRGVFGHQMQIDILIEMQMQTNTYTFPLVYYLLGFFKRGARDSENLFTIAPRSKLAARVVSAVWRASLLQFSTNRDESAHPFHSNSKATSLTFADAFIATHGAKHTCSNGLTLLATWHSPAIRQTKRDDLADSLLQAVALWAAPREIEAVLQRW